jgi:hypothetical protein
MLSNPRLESRSQGRFLSFMAQLHRMKFMADITIPRDNFRQLSKRNGTRAKVYLLSMVPDMHSCKREFSKNF